MRAWIAASWALALPAVAQGGDAAADSVTAEAARDTEARHIFEAGRTAYDAGRYEDALGYFQRGYELSQRPQLLYNVGQAADRLRRDEDALAAFRLYLEKLPHAENRPQVEERIRVLEAVLADKRAAAASVPLALVAPHPARPLATEAPPPRDNSDDNLLNQWWFWAGAGGVVVGVVIVAVLASSGNDNGEGGVTQGSNGMTIAVLSLP